MITQAEAVKMAGEVSAIKYGASRHQTKDGSYLLTPKELEILVNRAYQQGLEARSALVK